MIADLAKSAITAVVAQTAGAEAAADTGGSFWMPPEASSYAGDVDALWYFIYYLSAFFFVVIVGLTVAWAIKYRRRKKGQKTSPIKHNRKLELAWSVIPAILLVVIFFWGQKGFLELSAPPSDAMQIRVTGQKWAWTIDYPGLDKSCTNEMHVPVGKAVNLTITSVDVIHSFFVPAFRTKRDAVPGRYTGYWFEPNRPGTYDMYCAEYCGRDHSLMRGKVVVHTKEGWEDWLKSDSCSFDPKAPDFGERLFKKYGCTACHSIDGTRGVGPSLKDKFGTSEKLGDGSTVDIDDNYVRESILDPNAKLVAGFAPQMPPFAGRLKEVEINGLIDYLKSLSVHSPKPEAPKAGAPTDGADGAAPAPEGAPDDPPRQPQQPQQPQR